jgi:hypothetical protein
MSHSVHPYSHRLGIIRDWKSRWFAYEQGFSKCSEGRPCHSRIPYKGTPHFFLAGVEIERIQKALRVIVKTSRPGMIIGRAGDGVVKLREKDPQTPCKARNQPCRSGTQDRYRRSSKPRIKRSHRRSHRCRRTREATSIPTSFEADSRKGSRKPGSSGCKDQAFRTTRRC